LRLPNWFRIAWWLAITIALTWFLYRRYPDLVAGRSAPIDLVAFVIWIALLLAPVFVELGILGITLKQKIDEAAKEIGNQVSTLRAEVRNAVDVRATISPQFTFPHPPSDTQLPAIEKLVRAAIDDALRTYGVPAPAPGHPESVQLADDVMFLFATRYTMEKELRRILRENELELPGRRVGASMQLTSRLVEAGIIEIDLERAVRQVYAVCSPAIHGEPVSNAQVSFVREVAPGLITALRAIKLS
jgi:hypothetical protein